jgi:hypothetical protein
MSEQANCPIDPDVAAASVGRVITKRTPRPSARRRGRQRAPGPPKDSDEDRADDISDPSSPVTRPVDPDVVARGAGRFIAERASRPPTRRRRRRRAQIRGPPNDEDGGGLDAYSIAEFCRRHGISESFYHKLNKQGLGPRTLHLGARTLITKESAEEWRRQRTAATRASEAS